MLPEDEVLDVVDVEVQVTLDTGGSVPKAEVQPECCLRFEIRVADLEVPEMRAEVVELLKSRDAMRVHEAGHEGTVRAYVGVQGYRPDCCKNTT